MEEVPRRTSLVPLASPCFVLRLIGVETEALLDYQGRAGDHFHCAVEPSPGHIRCRQIRTNRKNSEQIGTNRGTPENKERKSEQIGAIGTNWSDPLLPTPKWGLRHQPVTAIFFQQGITYAPPPPSPPPMFDQKASLRGRGCVYLWSSPRQDFYTPPTFRRVFSGVGGWGCIKSGPHF